MDSSSDVSTPWPVDVVVWNSTDWSPTDSSSSVFDNVTVFVKPSDLLQLETVSIFFLLYSMIAIVPTGLIGNAFSITVFISGRNFRRTSTVQYLIALAITDSLFLVGDILFVFQQTGPDDLPLTSVDFPRTTDIGCKGVMWLRYT